MKIILNKINRLSPVIIATLMFFAVVMPNTAEASTILEPDKAYDCVLTNPSTREAYVEDVIRYYSVYTDLNGNRISSMGDITYITITFHTSFSYTETRISHVRGWVIINGITYDAYKDTYRRDYTTW